MSHKLMQQLFTWVAAKQATHTYWILIIISANYHVYIFLRFAQCEFLYRKCADSRWDKEQYTFLSKPFYLIKNYAHYFLCIMSIEVMGIEHLANR